MDALSDERIAAIVKIIRRDFPSVQAVSSRKAFELLCDAGLISSALCDRLNKKIGFRNIAVHAHQALDLAIVASVIENDLNDLLTFADAMLALED